MRDDDGLRVLQYLLHDVLLCTSRMQPPSATSATSTTTAAITVESIAISATVTSVATVATVVSTILTTSTWPSQPSQSSLPTAACYGQDGGSTLELARYCLAVASYNDRMAADQ